MFDLANTQFGTSIWGDEGFSAILSMKPYPDLIKTIINDTSPPLWNITERAAFLTFGTEEVVIRGLAFLYFVLAVFFVYKIGKLLFNRKAGVTAAALTFFNPFFFVYAFEGRMYSILALGVTASMYFFLRLQRAEEERKYAMLGYVIATTWALYSHHFAIFALVVQGFWFLFTLVTRKTRTAKRLFKAFFIIGLLYIPWVWPLYNQTRMVGGGFWLGTPDLPELVNLIYEYLAQGIKNDSVTIPYTNFALYDVSLYLVFIILVLRRWHKSIKKTVFFASWFLGPILLTWIVSQYFTSIFFNRYLLYTIPGAMLILASRTRNYSRIAIPVLLVVWGIIDFHYFTHPTKLPFREISDYVKETKMEGDFLVNWNSSSHHLWEAKYYGMPAPIYIPGGGELPFFVGTALMEEGDVISELPTDTTRVGVVTSGPVEEVELEGFTEEERREMKGLKFIWYQRK